jgi:ABC-type sugar transport system ATPase subunit
MVAGRLTPTSGRVTVGGIPLPPTVTPHLARSAGITAVYQELSIVSTMSVLENAFLGRMTGRLGLVDYRSLRREFADACRRLGVALDPDARAGTLSLADQQMLEIIRGLLLKSRVLLLDEPTAALANSERDALFAVMRDLRSDGVCLVLVTHNLEEVLANADVVSVFRDGRLVETRDVGGWSVEALVQKMLGKELQALSRVARSHASPPPRANERLVRLEQMSAGRLRDVSLHVGRGEVIGIGGLVGSGRSTLLRALSGLQPASSGRLWVNGRQVPLARTPRQAWQAGICLIPEDRKVAGIIPGMSGRENIVLGDMAATGAWGLVRRRHVRQQTEVLAQEYGLPDWMLDRPAGQLSGGNQQKLLLARWGFRAPAVLLADEATRGIDIGAKGQVLETLRRLADGGMAVVFVSSELEEVTAISDRVYVLHAGQMVGELDGHGDLGPSEILNCAFGVGADERV